MWLAGGKEVNLKIKMKMCMKDQVKKKARNCYFLEMKIEVLNKFSRQEYSINIQRIMELNDSIT
jgi:hypothetical protein